MKKQKQDKSKLNYSTDQIAFAEFAKALAHPARIKILGLLYKQSPLTCGEIVNYLPLSQPSVSQHLKELLRAGLVRAVHNHPKVAYYFEDKSLEIGAKAFNNVILREMFDDYIKGRIE